MVFLLKFGSIQKKKESFSLPKLFNEILRSTKMPDEWRNSTSVPFKNKRGNQTQEFM